jgi:uncharacterized membrane protein YraQ (UPF0718 family)
MAFLFASPLMNPALFGYTYGVLGIEMAMARTVTALSIGLVAGLGTHVLQARGMLAAELLPPHAIPAVAGGSGAALAVRVPGLASRFAGDLAFVGRWFTLGVFVAALTATFLSPELIRALLGPGSLWSVPAAVMLGVPLYACGGGAIPVVETMIRLGMTPGAALAFFIAGPATKFHTVGPLAAVFSRPVLACYLVVMIAAALAWGYLYPFADSLVPRIRP